MPIKLQPAAPIILCRTDSIGDMVLSLPLAGIIKQHYPSIPVYVIGKEYTLQVVAAHPSVTGFLSKEEVLKNPCLLYDLKAQAIIFIFPDKELGSLSKKAAIPHRIGTLNRLHHWWQCNHLVALSRKNSPLHEAQLNAKLLKPLGLQTDYTLEGLSPFAKLQAPTLSLEAQANCIIFHPKSKGSAREWPLDSYLALAKILTAKSETIAITGTAAEGELIRSACPELFSLPQVLDYTGRFSLHELIAFIALSKGLLACSTGPLHLAAALGKPALGLYPPIRPMHPGRWAPLGKNAATLTAKDDCNDCRNTLPCHCMQAIQVQQVAKILASWV